jgi:hypothetical protein
LHHPRFSPEKRGSSRSSRSSSRNHRGGANPHWRSIQSNFRTSLSKKRLCQTSKYPVKSPSFLLLPTTFSPQVPAQEFELRQLPSVCASSIRIADGARRQAAPRRFTTETQRSQRRLATVAILCQSKTPVWLCRTQGADQTLLDLIPIGNLAGDLFHVDAGIAQVLGGTSTHCTETGNAICPKSSLCPLCLCVRPRSSRCSPLAHRDTRSSAAVEAMLGKCPNSVKQNSVWIFAIDGAPTVEPRSYLESSLSPSSMGVHRFARFKHGRL